MSTILEKYGRLEAENAALKDYLAKVLDLLSEELRTSEPTGADFSTSNDEPDKR